MFVCVCVCVCMCSDSQCHFKICSFVSPKTHFEPTVYVRLHFLGEYLTVAPHAPFWPMHGLKIKVG